MLSFCFPSHFVGIIYGFGLCECTTFICLHTRRHAHTNTQFYTRACILGLFTLFSKYKKKKEIFCSELKILPAQSSPEQLIIYLIMKILTFRNCDIGHCHMGRKCYCAFSVNDLFDENSVNFNLFTIHNIINGKRYLQCESKLMIRHFSDSK